MSTDCEGEVNALAVVTQVGKRQQRTSFGRIRGVFFGHTFHACTFADRFTSNMEGFMKELIRERAVELSFEGHRFNDLRRWLLLTEYPYNIKTRQNFYRAQPLDPDVDPKENKVVDWEEEVIVERKLTSKHYWLPLKTEDVSMYPEFHQNPGW